MSIWSAFTNAAGGALKNFGDAFGGDQNQSFFGRVGKFFSGAYDVAVKAPVDLLGVGAHATGDVFNSTMNLDQRAYTDLISHPLSDLIDMGNKELYNFDTGQYSKMWQDVSSGSSWIQSWENSAHYSPGQEVMVGIGNVANSNNVFIHGIGEGGSGYLTAPDFAPQINPEDQHAVSTYFQNNWGARIGSGLTDGVLRWYTDPLQHVLKFASVPLKALKNNPVRSGSDLQKIISNPRTQKLIDWVVGKDSSTIAEHPAFRNSAFRWSIANALSGAKDRGEAELLMRTLMGDRAAYGTLALNNEALAYRAANMLAPAEAMEKFALAPGSFLSVNDWLQPVEKGKAAAAQAALRYTAKRYQDVMDAAGSMTDRTTSSSMAERSAALRSGFKYATPRTVNGSVSDFLHPMRLVSTIQDHAYNTPIRIYHALTDKPPMGFINHLDDSAPDQVRSWLNKSKVLTPDEKSELSERYSRMDRGQRAAGWNKIEDEVYNKVADAYNLDPEDMASVLNKTRQRASMYAAGAKSGAYGVISTPNGDKLHLLATADGELVAHPDLITQLERGAVPMSNLVDIERAIKRMDATGVLDNFRGVGSRGADVLGDVLDRVYGVWKPLSLLSMHRAYNHIGDDLLRGVAKLGGASMASNAVEGTANWLKNRIAPFTKNMWVRNQDAQWEQQVATARSQFHGLLSQAKDQKARIRNGETIPPENMVTTQDVRTAADRYTQMKNNKPVFVRSKNRLGTGTFVVPGTNIRLEEAFGGPNADYWRNITSSHQFFESQINDSAHNIYQSLMSNVGGPGYTVIAPSDGMRPWTKAYLHYVNNQLRPDPVAKQLLQGKDPALVEKWLSDTSSGQQYMRMLHKGDTHAQVQAVQDHIDKYLPTNQLKAAALGSGVKVAHINQTWKAASQMPEVNGNLNLLQHGGHPAVLSLKNTTNKILKWTGSIPDDIMVRHPLFNEMYKSRASTAIKVAADQSGGKLTVDEISRLQGVAMKQARKDLQGLVYDVSRFNDAGHMLRFISPFFNAWYGALSSWSKLFAQNPDLLVKAGLGKKALWGNLYAYDTSTGERATPNTSLNDLSIVVHLPKPLAAALGSSDLSQLPISASTLISPTYADSIGNPGFGPLVQVPLNRFAKLYPSVAEDPMIQTILGTRITANSLQSAIPSAATQLSGLAALAGVTGGSQDAMNRASLTWSIYQEQMYDYQSGLRSTPPNLKDIQGQAGYVSALDTILNRLSPLGFKPQASHEFYYDQYKSMLGQDPQNAEADFVKKYGEQAYVFTQSLGKNDAGVPATANGIRAYAKYQNLIAKDPSLAPVVIGVQGAGNFDEMAYQWEVANGLRTYQTPEQAATAAKVGKGWFNYQQMMAKVNIVLQDRGLTSINQSGAQDLKQFRTAYVSATGDPKSPYYNPDWYDAYGSFNQNAYNQRIVSLENLASDPSLLANPVRADIRGLNAYFQLRDRAMYYLSSRTNTSIKTSSNADVANWFDYYVGMLKQDNTQFGQLWERYLKDDTLQQP